MTVFDKIRQEHDKLRTLLELVGETHAGSAGRVQLFQRLRQRLLQHNAAEEEAFYAPLLKTTARPHVAHSIVEHERAGEMLDDLASSDPSSVEWIAKYLELRSAIERHMSDEEQTVFVKARSVMERGKTLQLAERFEAARNLR